MNKTKKLIIFGDKSYAEIVYEYFTHDSAYEVVAFTVDRKYITKEQFCGLPVIPFEEIENQYLPDQYDMHVAIVYGQLNRIREKICAAAKAKGYTLASYISSRAFIWHNAKVGENCFIFEDNTVQPFVEIQNNVILWSGNHIGHSSVIEDNVFISSHVVISGFCNIGHNCFIGVNTAIGNQVILGANCWISPGAIIVNNVSEGSLIKGVKSEIVPLNEDILFKRLAMMAE